MEIRINREVRNYHETIFFGLPARQFGCSLGAVAVAVGAHFLLKGTAGKETASRCTHQQRKEPRAKKATLKPKKERTAVRLPKTARQSIPIRRTYYSIWEVDGKFSRCWRFTAIARWQNRQNQNNNFFTIPSMQLTKACDTIHSMLDDGLCATGA